LFIGFDMDILSSFPNKGDDTGSAHNDNCGDCNNSNIHNVFLLSFYIRILFIQISISYISFDIPIIQGDCLLIALIVFENY